MNDEEDEEGRMTNDEAIADGGMRTDAGSSFGGNDFQPFAIESERASRFLIAALMALASPFLIDAMGLAALNSLRGETIIVPLIAGVLIAKFALLAIWLAWGGLRAVWRMLIVMVSVFLSVLAIPEVPATERQQLFLAWFVALLGCTTMLALPRLFAVRWINQNDVSKPGDQAAARPYQFSIVDLLFWTTMAAIVVGVIQAIGFRHAGAEDFVVMLILTAILATLVLAAMWAELTTHSYNGGRVALVVLLSLGLAFIVSLLTHAPAEAGMYILAAFLSMTSSILAALYVLRRLGHRLIRRV